MPRRAGGFIVKSLSLLSWGALIGCGAAGSVGDELLSSPVGSAEPPAMMPQPMPPVPPIPPVVPPLPIPGRFVALRPGSFVMGAPSADPCKGVNEAQHAVTLTRGFELLDREVSQADYLDVMGKNPSGNSSCGQSCPVEMISWHMAAAYCNALSLRRGLAACYRCSGSDDATTCVESLALADCGGYRLPTEAEWEYAYRAGGTSSGIGGELSTCSGLDPALDPYAWYYSNADFHNHPGATKQANAWGLYDMAGSVWEWVHDGYETDLGAEAVRDPVIASRDGFRVMRGGSWNCTSREIRASHRSGLTATIRGLNVGLRCARTLP